MLWAGEKGDGLLIKHAPTELKAHPPSCNYSTASASNYSLIELFTVIALQTVPRVKVDWVARGAAI